MSWPNVALGEIFDIARGGSPRPIDDYITDAPDGVNWISIRDASNSSKYITTTAKKIRRSGVSMSREVKPGDFLLTNSMSFGRPYILRTSGCIHDGWLVLRGDEDVINQDYFYHLLGSDFVYRKFQSLAAGAVVKNLNIDLVKTVKVPLPPLTEQRRIAAILDEADALRAKRREAIAKLDQLLQSVFLDMFGEPVANPKGWIREQLMELGRIQTGATPPTSEDGMFEGAVPFVTPGDLGGIINVSRRSLTVAGASKSRLAPSGSVLVCCIGATIGKMGYAQIDCAFNQQINAVIWGSKIKPKYGYYALRFFAEEIAHQGSSTTMPILKKSAFERLMLPVPSIGLQEDFERVVSQIEGQQHRALRALHQSDDFFSSLQWECFSGGARHAG